MIIIIINYHTNHDNGEKYIGENCIRYTCIYNICNVKFMLSIHYTCDFVQIILTITIIIIMAAIKVNKNIKSNILLL